MILLKIYLLIFVAAKNFLNLSVIKYSNIIMDVNIVRPLINYYKRDIYDYAEFYKIPYFLDITPGLVCTWKI